ncbi:FadR/GntR family transcriptional regulator [Azospirillum sp. ST 5-10]|uniref:FadR/GntR family transcriptional regulator n=1 Tax=unclassified Azospirillum TaxID=2630922 RepID=UPI003F49F219
MNGVSTVKAIFEELRKEIPERYRPGDLLPNERLLAERFGVGRNTIREVIVFLEAYGFVEKTQRGPRVCAPDVEAMFRILEQCFDRSVKTCREMLQFRRLIEVGILPEVVDLISDEEIALLDRLADEMEHQLTVREAAEIDFRFHATIVAASRNTMLQKMYQAMAQPMIYYLEIGKSNATIAPTTVNHHRQIVAALRERSYRKALEACSSHFNFSESVFNEESSPVGAAASADQGRE